MKSRIARAADSEAFDAEVGYLAVRSNTPVACATFAAVAAGATSAFAAGVAIIAVRHYFGHQYRPERIIDGSDVGCGSVRDLVDTRLATVAA